MEWQEDYKRKLVSAEEAVRRIVPGDRVVFQDGPEPERLLPGGSFCSLWWPRLLSTWSMGGRERRRRKPLRA